MAQANGMLASRVRGTAGCAAPTYVQLHKYKAFVSVRLPSDRAITTYRYGFFRARDQISGWHIDCLIVLSQ